MHDFPSNQYVKAYRVEPLRSVQAPDGKLSDVLAWLRNPPPTADVSNAKIMIDGILLRLA